VIELARLLKFDMLHPPWRLTERPTKRLYENHFLYGDPEGDHVIRTFDPAAKVFGVSRTVHARAFDPYDMDALEAEVEAEEAASERLGADDPAAVDPMMARMQADFGGEFAVTGAAGLSVPLNERWLAACALRGDLVARSLDAQLARQLVRVEAQAALGLRVIWGGGDLADKSGPVYGPKFFHEIVLPRYQKLIRRCHELGLWYVFRTDGNLWSIAEDLFLHSGIDGYGEIDHEAGMTLERLKPLYGDRVCFWGNVPAGGVLVRGTPGQVGAFARRLIEIAAPGGGFILGSSNSILPNTPPENVVAMFEAAER
jgi:uroporphyrinogen decarboxylase